MKELVFLLIGLLLGRYAIAQTAQEILEQNSTQLRYLAEQIVALKAYTAMLQDGYDMVGDGLDTISDINQADLAMHADYFNSLKKVSPAIATDPRVAMIHTYCQNTLGLCPLLQDLNDGLGATVASKLESACEQDENWLKTIVMNRDLQLQDAQRLALIGSLYEQAKVRYGFAAGLLMEFQTSAQNRPL